MRVLCLAPLLLLIACGGDDDGIVLDAGTPADAGILDSGAFAPGTVLLSTDTLDLGSIVVTSSDEAQLTVTNPGRDEVVVTLSQPAGPDGERFQRSVNVPETEGRFRLEGGGVATITVSATPEDEGPMLGVLALDSCGGACPTAILLLAEGVLSGVSCPAELDLGVVNPGDCVLRKLTCTNEGNTTERITVVELEPSSDPEFTITEPPLPVDFAPGAVLDVDVTYCAPAPTSNEGAVTIATFMPFETERTVQLRARSGGANVSCSPMMIDFGAVGVGASVSASALCANLGFEPATLDVSMETGAEFSVGSAGGVIAVGDTLAIDVVMAPTSVGLKQDNLLVVSNDPDQPTITIPVSGDALDVDPCSAVLSPAMRDLGLVGIGDARVTTFEVLNTGATACLVRTVGFAPSSAPGFSVRLAPAIGTVIGAGSSATVEVQFAPETSATVTGALVVGFSNPGTTELVGQIQALAGVTPIVIEPQVIDFGPTPLGCDAPSEKTVRIRRISGGSGTVLNVSVANDTNGVFGVNAVVPAQIEFFEDLLITVTFDPTAAQNETAELRIVTDTTPSAIILPISGFGVMTRQRTDTVTLTAKTVDVLLVVDDSCSMAPAQAALANAMPLLDQIRLDRTADVHVGVVTTDMDDPLRSGRIIGGVLDNSTPNFQDELIARVTPGIDGSGDEQGILAVYAALTEPLIDTDNAGLLRPDADLAVVIVSDENDFSPSTPSIPTVVGAARRAAGNGRLIFAGIVGPPSATCSGPYGNGDAADRYAGLIGRTEGSVLTSFCSDMSRNIETIADEIFGSTTIELGGRPVIASINVSVDGSALATADWSYDLSRNVVVIHTAQAAPVGATVEVSYDAVCLSATCYDGTQDPGELCDDNNTANDDTCIDCMPAVCGDGIVQTNVEACDDGNLVDEDTCLTGCTSAVCGDGVLQFGVEECDDGNTVGGDGCPSTCRFYVASALTPQAFVPLQGGTTLVFAGGADPSDDGVAEIVLPFSFDLFGVPSSTLTVSVNGFVTNSSGQPPQSWVNTGLPNADAPNGTMAVWWDDLFLDTGINGGADISWEILGSTPNRVAVIEWRDLRAQDHNTSNHRRFTFQLRLAETTNAITFAYADTETQGGVPTVVSASAGIEDDTGMRGLEALGCSPDCDGRPRPPRADGFPEQSVVTFTP